MHKKTRELKNTSMILLGAGSPHSGEQHSALHSTIGNASIMDWLLQVPVSSGIESIFVGGFQLEKIRQQFPSLNTIHNARWSETKSAYSALIALDYAADNAIVSYSDILYRPQAVEHLNSIQSDIVIAVDTQWKTRFVGRTQQDQAFSEKVCIHQGKVMRLGADISVVQANAEFVGLVKFSEPVVKYLKQHQEKLTASHAQATLSELIETLRINGFDVAFIDVKGDWAELNQPEDLAHFILGTKAQTLQRLQSMVKFSRIEDQVSFTLAEWQNAKEHILEQIKAQFDTNVVIRSSAITEDGFSESNAGAYTSLLNIPTDIKSLTSAIETVIASYPDKNPDNQVLVQPMLQKVQASGVVFTRVLNTGAPYYFANYDDVTGSTESITSGNAKEHKTLIIRRDAAFDNGNIPEKLRSLLPALRELESLLNYTALDVEFALTDQGLHILQVRPIAVKNQNAFDEPAFYQAIENAKHTFTGLQTASPFAGQAKAIFGVMPDWNPAEIIGTKPTPLATSLYRHLIMDEIWATQRAEYGYQDVRPHPLLVDFVGHPYVDIRASFSSFVPSSLSAELRDKLVRFYIQWLEQNPHLHDKVEFDVVPTCYALDFDRWQQRLAQHAGLTQDEITGLELGLKAITKQAFERVDDDLDSIEKLNQRYKGIINTPLNPIAKAALLLEDCKRYGTLPFAHLARAGFIAVTLLKSAVSKTIISQNAFDGFMAGIRTVSHQLSEDADAVKNGRLAWQVFVDKYAHLRPGTYDIKSESYGANPEHYLRPLTEQISHAIHQPDNQAWLQEREYFRQALDLAGFNIDLKAIESFLHQAIEGREYAKFMFSRNLSTALDLIRDWGESQDLNVNDLAYLKLVEILDLNAQLTLDDQTFEKVKERIEARKVEHSLIKSIELPPLICSEQDFDVFQYPHSQANFVGTKPIMAECIDLSAQSNNPDNLNLAGLVVMIPQADPGYDWLFGRNIAGLVTMYGGANSHMAIRAAEFGLPAAIGIGEARYQALSTAKVLELDPASRQLKVIR